jgi:FkbM family methyltransferase
MALTHVWMIQEYSNSGFDINDSDIVIDIGAHIGLFALFASQFCKQGKIFCFEPIKENYELLVENINSNKIKNIIPFNFAVSKESDSVKIFLNDDYSGHSMFLETNNFVIVKSKSLLDIFSENNIQECNFLKLDCEGAEYDIINSLPSDFLNKIKKSVIEYHLADTHPKLLEQLIKKLRKCSFIVNTRPLFSDIGFLFANKK